MNYFKDPIPKSKVEISHINSVTWPIQEEIQLIHKIKSGDEVSFLEILESRKTRRTFSKLEKQQVGELLYLSQRVITTEMNVNGLTVQHRPVISAGGLHVISSLLHFPGEEKWYRYDPIKHVFQCLNINISTEMINEVRSFFPTALDATIIWYVGNASILSAKYEHPDTLLFRDAGAIMSTQSLVSEYLNYAYCPLGITGDKYAKKLLNEGQLFGVGIALVGDQL